MGEAGHLGRGDWGPGGCSAHTRPTCLEGLLKAAAAQVGIPWDSEGRGYNGGPHPEPACPRFGCKRGPSVSRDRLGAVSRGGRHQAGREGVLTNPQLSMEALFSAAGTMKHS